MPVIPRATQQTNVPGFEGPSQAGAGLVVSEQNRLQGKLGDTQRLISALKQERNIALSADKVYKFEAAARVKVGELTALRGGNAVELEKQYNDWYDRAVQEYGADLKGNTQQTYFRVKTRGRKDSDLRSLQGHELAEHQKFIESSRDAVYDSRKKDAAAFSSDPERVEAAIEEVNEWVDAASPGMDNTEEKQARADQLKLIAIRSAVKKDPANAMALLKRWEKDLGDRANEVNDAVNAEFLYFSAKTEHDDFDDQFKMVKEMKGVTEPVRRAVTSRIKTDKAEVENRETEQRIERRTVASNSYWAALGEKNFGRARRIAEDLDVKGGDFTEQERQAFLARTEKSVVKTDEIQWRGLRWDILKGKFADKSTLWLDKRSASVTNEDMVKLENLLTKELQEPSQYRDALNDVEWAFRNIYKEDPDQGMKFLMYQREFMRELGEAEKNQSRRLTPDEVRALGVGGLEKRVKDSWFFGLDVEGNSKFEQLWENRQKPRADGQQPEKPSTKSDTLLNAEDPAEIR